MLAQKERISTGYKPRPLQAQLHRSLKRWNVLVAHRRFGKTVFCIAELVDQALRCKLPMPRYAYIAPYFIQAKSVAWDYLKLYTRPIPGVRINEAELRVDLPNGARISLYGADNADRLRGLYYDGVVADEMADMPANLLPVILRPALSDRKGWLIAIGTPKGRNEFYDLYKMAEAAPDWFAATFRASETGLVDPEELASIAASLTVEQYNQEMECSFDAAITGAYYGKEIADAEKAGRVGAVPVDPNSPVHTAWDLGIGDSTAIWFFQVAGGEIHVIDHYENHGQGLPHYVAEIKARGYTLGTHYLPHDANARELGSGRTRLETLRGLLGFKIRVLPAQSVMDGINAGRVTLASTYFDADKCRAGLEALRQYRAEFDEKAKTFRDRPKHDWTSHSADAFRYLAMAWREMKPVKPPPKPVDSWTRAFQGGGETVDDWRVA
jgi:phage terminase large subunit